MLAATLEQEISLDEFLELARSHGWSFDAWMQASLNAHQLRGGTEATFSSIVEGALYVDLLKHAAAWGIEKALTAAFNNPQLNNAQEFKKIAAFLETRYPDASVVPLARVLARTKQIRALPDAVITFNYDTILETALRMDEISAHQLVTGKHVFPESTYRRVTGPLLKASPKVPFIYLHGCVTPRTPRRRMSSPHDTRDRLVGPESSYLRLSSSVASWAQTMFMYHAQNKSLAIIGHSLSDPNLRRWLAWATGLRNQEVKAHSGKDIMNLPHVWLRRRPARTEHQRILEGALIHLGVRIAWIDSWSELTPALENLLALPKPKPLHPVHSRPDA